MNSIIPRCPVCGIRSFNLTCDQCGAEMPEGTRELREWIER